MAPPLRFLSRGLRGPLAVGLLALGLLGASDPTTPRPAELEEEALRILEAQVALRRDPLLVPPHLDLGEAYYRIGNLAAARHHLEVYLRGAATGPDSIRGAHLHARTLLRAGLRLRATRALQKLVARPGSPPEADHDLSLLLREDGFLAEAAMAEMRALERGGPTAERLREAAYQWKELRRLDQSARLFSELTGSGLEATAEDWFQFGYLAHRTKRFGAAEQAYDRCLEADPTHAEAHYNASLLAEREERIDSAAYHLEQVLRLRPQYEPAYFQLGRLFLEHERPVEAASVFRRFLEFGTDSLALAEARQLLQGLVAEP